MLILAAVLAIFVYGVIAAMLGTILPGLAERFHLTPNQNGVIAFAQALGLMLASLGVGPLIDLRMCEERKTVWPRRLASLTVSRNATSIRGSRPEVGSSRISSSARLANAAISWIF